MIRIPHRLLSLRKFAAFSLVFCLLCAMSYAQSPGEQVLQTVALPKSTSTWDYKDGIPQLGKPVPVDADATEEVAYWLFLPVDYKDRDASDAVGAGDGSPLLLFLHGAGERGDNPELVKVHGPPKLLQDAGRRKNWPFLTVSPQCRAGHRWSPEQLMLLLDEIERKYNVDKSRIYVTGISMGGYGTWMLLNEKAERFAAAAPICGGGDPEWTKRMTGTPIWAFHGDADGAVPFEAGRRMIEAAAKSGNPDVQLTVYPGVGHDSWTRTYDNPALYAWLLSKRRK